MSVSDQGTDKGNDNEKEEEKASKCRFVEKIAIGAINAPLFFGQNRARAWNAEKKTNLISCFGIGLVGRCKIFPFLLLCFCPRPGTGYRQLFFVQELYVGDSPVFF